MRIDGTRILLLTTLLSASFLLGSCSNRFGYNMLDWWARGHIRQHVSLDREQKRQMHDYVDKIHHWHRETQLPLYADFLEESLVILESTPVSKEQMEALMRRVVALWHNTLEQLVAPAADLGSTLSDAQVEELLENIRETQEENLQKGAGQEDEEQYEFYLERMLRNMERWVGSATEEQKQWLEDWVQTVHLLQDESAQAQGLWLEALADALDNRRDRKALEQSLRQLILDPSHLYPDDYVRRAKENQHSTLAIITQINNNLTDRQRAYRRKEFTRYIEDFRHLSR